jgi:hypothetical protein
MFFNKEEVFHRVHRRWNKAGQKQDGYLGIHTNTRCKLPGFISVGPIYNGNRKLGLAWFDVRVRVGSPEYFELDEIMKQVCNELRLQYMEVTK